MSDVNVSLDELERSGQLGCLKIVQQKLVSFYYMTGW